MTATARYLVLGAGGAGVGAAERIRELDRDSDITVISSEKNMPISPVALPDYIEGSVARKDLFLWDRQFVEDNQIDLILGTKVERVLCDKRRVLLEGGESLSFDKLLIATGASPIITPDLAGREKVFGLRTLDDAEAIKSRIKKRAVVYGAGAVAVKVAVALRRIGVDVIVLCRSRVLRRLFDDDICSCINDMLADGGVRLVGSCELNTCGSIDSLRIGNDEISYDGIIAAMGVKPNISFVDAHEMRIGQSGGIAVDERMETSVAGIFAAGDCAETLDITTGRRSIMALWPPAVRQGKVAAMNMLGRKEVYDGTLPSNAIKVFDREFVTMGSLEGEKVSLRMGRADMMRFTIRDGKIVGCQMVGAVENAGIIASIIRQGVAVQDLDRLELFPYGKIANILPLLFRSLSQG